MISLFAKSLTLEEPARIPDPSNRCAKLTSPLDELTIATDRSPGPAATPANDRSGRPPTSPVDLADDCNAAPSDASVGPGRFADDCNAAPSDASVGPGRFADDCNAAPSDASVGPGRFADDCNAAPSDASGGPRKPPWSSSRFRAAIADFIAWPDHYGLVVSGFNPHVRVRHPKEVV